MLWQKTNPSNQLAWNSQGKTTAFNSVMLAFHDTELQVTQIQQLAQSQASNLLGRMHMVSFWLYPKFQTNLMHNLWSILQIALFIWRQQIMNEETSFMMQARLSELDDRDLKQTWHPGSGGLHW
jgi:hypothetical protein